MGSLEPLNFSPRAQQALALARREADSLRHNFVGAEHLLLGVLALERGVAVSVFRTMGLEIEIVRLEVEKQVGKGLEQPLSDPIPYAPRLKKILAVAAREAKALNHTYIGTEHLLLGLLREGDGVTARVLKNLNVHAEQTRIEILKELGPNAPSTAKSSQPSCNPKNMTVQKSQLDPVDVNKRYDVYCVETNQLLVYRNALFKGRRKLLSIREHDIGAEFIELEQSNGQTVYLSLHAVRKFCEHNVKIVSDVIPPT